MNYIMPKSKFPRPISGRMMKGILKEPMYYVNPTVVGLYALNKPDDVSSQLWEAASVYDRQQRLERLMALAGHYEIDVLPDDVLPDSGILKLLFALAADFVVGFNYDKMVGNIKAGRKKGKTKFDRYQIWMAVTSLTRDKGMSVASACADLSKQRRMRWYGASPRALEQQFIRHNVAKKASFADFQAHPLNIRLGELVAPFTRSDINRKPRK